MTRKLTPQKRADEWRPVFLDTLRNSANVRLACQAAGVSRPSAYAAKAQSAEFGRQWEQALEDACDILEAVARKRAQESSDTLLIFLLKSHRPAVYRETYRHEHTGKDGGAIEIADARAELARRVDELAERRRAQVHLLEPERATG